MPQTSLASEEGDDTRVDTPDDSRSGERHQEIRHGAKVETAFSSYSRSDPHTSRLWLRRWVALIGRTAARRGRGTSRTLFRSRRSRSARSLPLAKGSGVIVPRRNVGLARSHRSSRCGVQRQERCEAISQRWSSPTVIRPTRKTVRAKVNDLVSVLGIPAGESGCAPLSSRQGCNPFAPSPGTSSVKGVVCIDWLGFLFLWRSPVAEAAVRRRRSPSRVLGALNCTARLRLMCWETL